MLSFFQNPQNKPWRESGKLDVPVKGQIGVQTIVVKTIFHEHALSFLV